MPEERVAYITGGAQGIGRAIAERCLRDGLRVAIVDADDAAGRETEAMLRERGAVDFQACDVGREEDVRRTLAACLARFGRLDLVVNNAGIMHRRPVAELSLDDWRRVLDVNLTAAFLTAKHASPELRRTRGSIVNIASTRALMSEPDTEAYAASKGGLVALSHALAVSLGPDVRVNCISPGWIDVSAWKKSSRRKPEALSEQDHRQHPVGRVGQPEDVAELVAYLASPAAGFITGANLVIDGGMTRKMIYV